MTLETIRSALMWCAIINYGLLIIWVAVAIFGGARFHRLWGRFLHLSREQFDTLNFAGITLYKTGIFMFNIVPCIALWIVG